MSAQFDPRQVEAAIVDAQTSTRRAIRTVLQKMGVSAIREYTDPSELIEQTDSTVNLLLVDIALHDGMGYELLSSIRSRAIGCDIPIIVVSGYADRADIVKSSSLGADEFVVKPFPAGAIQDKIEAVLNNYFEPSPLKLALREGDLALTHKEIESAKRCYHKALEIEPKSARIRYSLALADYRLGNHTQALSILEKNTRDNPAYVANYRLLADLHLQAGSKIKGAQYLKMELELNPKQAVRQTIMGELLSLEGRHEEAIQYYRNAYNDNPRKKQPIINLAKSYAELRRFDKCFLFLSRHRKTWPEDPEPLKVASMLNLSERDVHLKEQWLRDFVLRNPSDLQFQVYLAKFCLERGKVEEARKVCTKISLQKSNSLEELRVRALLASYFNNHEELVFLLKKLVEQDPVVEELNCLAESLFALEQVGQGIGFLERALRIDPTFELALFNLARGFFMSRQYVKALLVCSRCPNLSSEAKNLRAKCRDQLQKRRSS